MAVIRKILAIISLIVILETTAQARLKYMLLYNMYNQNGSGGKQVYDGSGDQDLTVNEPLLFLDYEVNNYTTISGKFTLDTFSGASDAIFDTRTGASGSGTTTGSGNEKENDSDDSPGSAAGAPIVKKWENRRAFDLSLSHQAGTWVLIPSAGFSTEEDYRSSHAALNVQKSFLEDNFVLAAGISHYDDFVNLFDLNTARFTGWTPRLTDSYVVSASQILSPNALFLLGAGFTRQTGRLSGERNTVDLAGTRVQEILPGERNKMTGTLRFIQGLNTRLALHLDYRYYKDDWELTAHTYEPSLAIGLGERQASLLRLFYRYYTQNAVEYYRDSFSGRLPFMTSDSDLAKFDSNEYGLQGSFRFDIDRFFSEIELGGGVIFYRRSNDLSAVIYQISLGGSF